MKKLFIIGLMLILTMGCWGIDIFRGTEQTPTWFAVTEMDDGTPVSPTDSISYEIYMSPVADPDNPSVPNPQDVSQHIFVGSTVALDFTVAVPQDGICYAIAIRTVLIDEDLETHYSGLNWSFENGEWTPNPFLYQGKRNPKRPKGLNRA